MVMDKLLVNDWREKLYGELAQPYMKQLIKLLESKYEKETIYPARDSIFNSLRNTSYEDVKVVLLGQDPYHGAGQANGLSFSVQKGVKLPPSLRNIYQELVSDIGCNTPQHGSLEAWAGQGVLLLNTVLTVEAGKPGSHRGIGWEKFTDRIIRLLNDREKPIVFVLWGRHAQEKASYINGDKHCVITSPHPSPFAARKGFFGSRPFSKANAFLTANAISPVNWSIPE